MKEIFIISTGQIIGAKSAGSRRVLNIAKSLAAGEVNVFLCSYLEINNNHPESYGLHSGIYHLQSHGSNKKSSFHMFGFLRSLDRYIRARNTESAIYLYPSTFVLKDLIYLLYFKFLRRYKFFCEINELRTGIAFSASAPKKILHKLYFYLKSLYDYIAYKLNEFQVPFYDGIVVISTSLEKYFAKYAVKNLRVPILCDITKIKEALPQNHFDNTVFRICFAGYIKSEKEGFDLLFEALSQVNLKRNVELYLYGILADSDREILNKLTDTFNLGEKVFYMGNIDPEDLPGEFSKYHLLILPRPLNSRTKYGFSTKLSEYLISGIPVLLTDVSDNALYIKDNYNGFIIPPGSIQKMTDKILTIIEHYNENASLIAENAYKTAREEFDYKLYTQPLINFFFNN